jgi:predicted nucleic acid-binding protein
VATHYIDTSALIKVYVPEIGSVRVNALFEAQPLAMSALVRVEVSSALARRVREGTLTAMQRDRLYERHLRNEADFLVLAVTAEILDRAADLARTSPPGAPLRALDAIHLASALVIFEAQPPEDGSTGTFVTSDRQLRRAAEHAGLDVLDPEA